MEVHDDVRRNTVWLRFGDRGCWLARAVGVGVEAPADGRGEPLRSSEEPHFYGWMVGGGAACLASEGRCQLVPSARNSGLERILGRYETSGVERAGEFGTAARSHLPGRRRAPESRRLGLRCGLAAGAYGGGCKGIFLSRCKEMGERIGLREKKVGQVENKMNPFITSPWNSA